MENKETRGFDQNGEPHVPGISTDVCVTRSAGVSQAGAEMADVERQDTPGQCLGRCGARRAGCRPNLAFVSLSFFFSFALQRAHINLELYLSDEERKSLSLSACNKNKIQ